MEDQFGSSYLKALIYKNHFSTSISVSGDGLNEFFNSPDVSLKPIDLMNTEIDSIKILDLKNDTIIKFYPNRII